MERQRPFPLLETLSQRREKAQSVVNELGTDCKKVSGDPETYVPLICSQLPKLSKAFDYPELAKDANFLVFDLFNKWHVSPSLEHSLLKFAQKNFDKLANRDIYNSNDLLITLIAAVAQNSPEFISLGERAVGFLETLDFNINKYSCNVRGLGVIWEYGSKSEEAEKTIKDFLCSEKTDCFDKQAIIWDLFYISRYFWSESKVRKFVQEQISQYGVDGEDLLDWWASGPELNPKEYPFCFSNANLGTLQSLENYRPGSVSLLYNEFGIRDFGRYGSAEITDLIIRQCEQIDDKQEPYGLVLSPKHDHLDALNFISYAGVYNELAELSEKGLCNISFAEVDSSLSAIRMVNKFRKKYGKMSFMVLEAHGTEMSIQLAEDEFIEIGDILSRGAASLLDAFTEDATIILNSCSTGAKGGIGEMMAKQGIRVIAPNIPTALHTIHAKVDENGKLILDAVYKDSGCLQEYVGKKSSYKTAI